MCRQYSIANNASRRRMASTLFSSLLSSSSKNSAEQTWQLSSALPHECPAAVRSSCACFLLVHSRIERCSPRLVECHLRSTASRLGDSRPWNSSLYGYHWLDAQWEWVSVFVYKVSNILRSLSLNSCSTGDAAKLSNKQNTSCYDR